MDEYAALYSIAADVAFVVVDAICLLKLKVLPDPSDLWASAHL